MKTRHTSATLQGGLCGSLWWPVGQLAGFPITEDMRARFARFAHPDAGDHITFRDALLSVLSERGGDFQGASFTEDTELVLRMEKRDGSRSRIVVKGIPLSSLPDCADLVRAEAFAGDFNGE